MFELLAQHRGSPDDLQVTALTPPEGGWAAWYLTDEDDMGESIEARELIIFDPAAAAAPRLRRFPLQVYRRTASGAWKRVLAGPGPVYSVELDAWLVVVPGPLLRISRDSASRDLVHIPEEQVIALREQVLELRQDNAALRHTNTVLRQDIAVLRQDIAVLHQENAELRRENTVLRQDITVLQQENAELRRENAELRRENTELRQENAELRTTVAAQAERITTLEATVARLITEVARLLAEVTRQNAELAELRARP